MRAILLLGAGIQQNESKKWESTDLISMVEKGSAPGGRVRVHATAYLFHQGGYNSIIISGGKGNDLNIQHVIHPTVSSILRKELNELGISDRYMIEEDLSHTTYEQLERSLAIIQEYRIQHITLVTNRYHMSRVKAFMQSIERLSNGYKGIEVTYIPAEDVCLAKDVVQWESFIHSAYESNWMKILMQKENTGREHIINGTYQF